MCVSSFAPVPFATLLLTLRVFATDAFDEAGPEYSSAVRLLFGSIKRRWPEVNTLSALNWPPTAVVDVLDIWVVRYDQLERSDMAKAKIFFQANGKQGDCGAPILYVRCI
jgi:hypothetical protein